MPFARRLGGLSFVLSLAACASPLTELVVVVDTDLRMPSELDALEIVITPPAGDPRTQERALTGDEMLPFTLTVVPSGELGPFEVRAVGRLDGAVVVTRSARTTLVRGESRTLILHLARACVGVTCASGETCVESGACHDVDDPVVLPWSGRPPRLGEDAGTPVDGGRDASADAGTDASVEEDCRLTGCDDDERCTEDVCNDVSHHCEHRPLTASCDDGAFCNGLDHCADGTCSGHTGDACLAGTTCDETDDVCTGCTTDDECPAPIEGAWGTCASSDACAVEGTETRTRRTFACVTGRCEPTDGDEMRACPRTTEGTPCAMSTCDAYGACMGSGATCDPAGTATRTCTDFSCRSGVCASGTRPESMACTRSTDGASCGELSCGAWGGCGGFADVCALGGTESRACSTPVCGGGSCGSAPSSESRGCTRPSTDGTPCGGATTCDGWSACAFGDACTTTGTQSRTCYDPVCVGGGCGSTPRTETQSCTRGPTDGTTCGGDVCDAYGACGGFVGICGEDGTQTRTCYQQRCGGGACGNVNPYSDVGACHRDRSGVSCGRDRTCFDGVCECTLC